MPFDPQVQAIHDRLERDQPARLYTMSIEDARAADVASAVASAGLTEPVADVTDRSFPGPAGQLPVRVYRPDGEGPWPVLVYFYGGGWSLGTLDTCDGVCRSLAEAGVPVELTRYDGMPHAFFTMIGELDTARSAVAAAAARLREAFG
jgi:acetyl esterase